MDVGRNWGAIPVDDFEALGRQHAKLMISQVNHLIGDLCNGCRVARKKLFAISKAQDQRTAQSRSDDQVRISWTHDREAIRTSEQRQHPPKRLDQVVVKAARNELRNDFRIGIALKDDALGFKLALQL